jgi:predicted DCC family thiol-disulfide oxidoreductase YuxK
VPVDAGAAIILYDGVCGLCNHFVRFVLRRDPARRFRFAWLQSGFAGEILARHGKDPHELDTVCVVVEFGEPSEHLLLKSRAALFVLAEIGGGWRGVARALDILPLSVLDAAYGVVSKLRYRLFGRYDSCPLPQPGDRERFIDL